MQYWFLTEFLAFIIISLLSVISLKNLLLRFGILKSGRRDYYECGFRPHSQKPIQISSQFFIICILFLIYDIELIFSFPLVSSLLVGNFLDLFNFLLIYLSMIFSLIYDYDKGLLEWKFI